MIVNFDIELKDFNGELIIAESPNGLQSTVSLKAALQKELYFKGHPYLSRHEKLMAYRLAAKMNNPNTDYSEQELDIVLMVAENCLANGIFGQVVELIGYEEEK